MITMGSPHVMLSVHIDMKMILPLNWSGSHLNSANWHEDDPSFEVLVHTLIPSSSFESRREFQRSEPWEIFPLEFHRLPVDSIQIFEIACLQIPFNFVSPSLDLCGTGASQTQHRVGKDVGWGFS